MTSIMPVTGVPDAARSSSASQDAQTNQAMAQEQQLLNPTPSTAASPAAIISLSQAASASSTQDERATTSPTPTAESPPQTVTASALSTTMSSEAESPNGYTSAGAPSFESQSNDLVNSQINFLA